jgi:hypothetical protein
MSTETTPLPSPVTIATDTLSVFMKDLAPFLLVALGPMIAALVGLAVVMPLGFGCMFGGFMGSAAIGTAMIDPNTGDPSPVGAILMAVGMIGSYLGFFVLVFGGLSLIITPVQASALRAIDKHLAGEEVAGFGGGFSTATSQIGKDVGTTLAYGLLVALGLPFFYVGALVAVFFLGMAPHAAMLDGDSPGKALAKAFAHTRANLTWHLTHLLVLLVFGMIASNIPLLGPAALSLYQVRAYRAAFPRGQG